MKLTRTLAAATSLALALASFSVSTPAQASTNCRNTGFTQRQFSVGSQVDGRLFTICAKTALGKRLKSTGTHGLPKTTASKPIANRINKKVNPTGEVLVSTIRVQNHTQLVFRPIAPRITKNRKGKLHIGQQVRFAVSNQTRYGFSYTQGRKIGVRFVPIKFELRFSDQKQSSQATVTRSFAAAGVYRVTALVTYAPSYRVLKAGEWVNRRAAKWMPDPGNIKLASNTVSVVVVSRSWVGSQESQPVLVSGKLVLS